MDVQANNRKNREIQTLVNYNTTFAQWLKFVPRARYEFESLANPHHQGRKPGKMTRWSQFVALTMARLSGRFSLRDIVSNLSAQATGLYHLGSAAGTRSTLARVNRCNSLDATTIDLCPSVFSWARFRATKEKRSDCPLLTLGGAGRVRFRAALAGVRRQCPRARHAGGNAGRPGRVAKRPSTLSRLNC